MIAKEVPVEAKRVVPCLSSGSRQRFIAQSGVRSMNSRDSCRTEVQGLSGGLPESQENSASHSASRAHCRHLSPRVFAMQSGNTFPKLVAMARMGHLIVAAVHRVFTTTVSKLIVLILGHVGLKTREVRSSYRCCKSLAYASKLLLLWLFILCSSLSLVSLIGCPYLIGFGVAVHQRRNSVRENIKNLKRIKSLLLISS